MATVCLIGVGNLGKLISRSLSRLAYVTRLVLIGRNQAIAEWAALLNAVGTAAVSFECINALREASLKSFFQRCKPDVVIQCASLLSPWQLQRSNSAGRAIFNAGFAFQLPAQLPVALATMRAVAEAKLTCPVINCSYPDVVNCVLGKLGVAPAVGIGNISMIECVIRRNVIAQSESVPVLHVFGHHSHVLPTLTGATSRLSPPLIYLDHLRQENVAKLIRTSRMPRTADLNVLTAHAAMHTIEAVMQGHSDVIRSAPGPIGLPGGYPIVIREGRVSCALPSGLALLDAIAFNEIAAQADGIAGIDSDGSVHFTEEACRMISDVAPSFARPLKPGDCLKRFQFLQEVTAC